VAERIMAQLADSFQIDGQEIGMSGSLGISICPHDGADCDSLLKKADTATYRAKQAGRNTYRFFRPEMTAGHGQRIGGDTPLREALDRAEFAPSFQA
jgi:predicted signal transduction protein with EAL and GGDEF domain